MVTASGICCISSYRQMAGSKGIAPSSLSLSSQANELAGGNCRKWKRERELDTKLRGPKPRRDLRGRITVYLEEEIDECFKANINASMTE